MSLRFLCALLALQLVTGSSKIDQKTKEWFEEYQDHDDIVQWTIDLAENYPTVASLVNIGSSLEGRPMNVLRITIPTGAQNKTQIYIEGQIHAREWISGATTQYIAHYLITNAFSDPRVESLLERVEVLVLMMVNPDGYSYSRTNDRNWRKNRKRNADGSFGVDLNRNFDDKWGLHGSNNPSSGNFQGTSAASEIEVQNIQNFFLSEGRVIAGIDFHCCGQLINRPFGWTYDDAVGEDLMSACGQGMAQAMQGVNGRRYVSQQSIFLYTTSATSKDWFNGDQVKNITGIRAYGYIIELPTEANNNGALIVGVGEENLASFLYMSEFALLNPILE